MQHYIQKPLSTWCRSPQNSKGYPRSIKKDTSLRPIVSSRGAVTYGLVKELINIFRPLIGHSPHYIRNTQDFVDQVKPIRHGERKCITYCDVKSIFTPVPVDSVFSIIRHKFNWDTQLHLRTSMSIQNIIMLLKFCLKNTFSSSEVSIMNRCIGQPKDPLSAPLWSTCSWKSLKPRTSTLPPIYKGYGWGMWMTLLWSKRQNKSSCLYSTSTPLTHTFNSAKRLQAQMVQFLFWTL